MRITNTDFDQLQGTEVCHIWVRQSQYKTGYYVNGAIHRSGIRGSVEILAPNMILEVKTRDKRSKTVRIKAIHNKWASHWMLDVVLLGHSEAKSE